MTTEFSPALLAEQHHGGQQEQAPSERWQEAARKTVADTRFKEDWHDGEAAVETQQPREWKEPGSHLTASRAVFQVSWPDLQNNERDLGKFKLETEDVQGTRARRTSVAGTLPVVINGRP